MITDRQAMFQNLADQFNSRTYRGSFMFEDTPYKPTMGQKVEGHLKKHWKKYAVGAGILAAGAVVGRRYGIPYLQKREIDKRPVGAYSPTLEAHRVASSLGKGKPEVVKDAITAANTDYKRRLHYAKNNPDAEPLPHGSYEKNLERLWQRKAAIRAEIAKRTGYDIADKPNIHVDLSRVGGNVYSSSASRITHPYKAERDQAAAFIRNRWMIPEMEGVRYAIKTGKLSDNWWFDDTYNDKFMRGVSGWPYNDKHREDVNSFTPEEKERYRKAYQKTLLAFPPILPLTLKVTKERIKNDRLKPKALSEREALLLNMYYAFEDGQAAVSEKPKKGQAIKDHFKKHWKKYAVGAGVVGLGLAGKHLHDLHKEGKQAIDFDLDSTGYNRDDAKPTTIKDKVGDMLDNIRVGYTQRKAIKHERAYNKLTSNGLEVNNPKHIEADKRYDAAGTLHNTVKGNVYGKRAARTKPKLTQSGYSVPIGVIDEDDFDFDVNYYDMDAFDKATNKKQLSEPLAYVIALGDMMVGNTSAIGDTSQPGEYSGMGVKQLNQKIRRNPKLKRKKRMEMELAGKIGGQMGPGGPNDPTNRDLANSLTRRTGFSNTGGY